MATELENLVVKIQADVESLKKDMAEATKATIDATEKMSKGIDEFSDKSKKSLLDFHHIAETAFGVFGGEALLEGVKHVGEVFKEFFEETIGEGVHAASENEETVTRLNFSLAQAGKYSRDASDDLQEFAESLQHTTKFENDAILKTEATIESLGRLDKEGLQKATKAALDLATGLHIDLESATLLVGKAAAGNISMFQRHGITMTEGATKAETFANALQVINSRFGNAAAAQVNNFGGAVAQIKNQFEDFGKELGFTVTKNQAVVEVIKAAREILEELTDWVKENRQQIKEWLAEGIDKALAGVQAFSSFATSVLIPVTQTISATFQTVGMAIAAVAAAVSSLAEGNFKGVIEVFKQFKNDAADAFSEIGKEGPVSKAFDAMGEAAKRLRDAAHEGFKAVKNGAEESFEPVNQARQYADDLTAAQVKMGEAGKKLAEKMTEFNPSEYYKQQFDLIKVQFEQHQLTAEEFVKKEKDLHQAERQDELTKLKEALNQKLISEASYKIALENLEKKHTAEIKKEQLEQAKFELQVFQERMGYASSFFGSLSSLMSTKSKELFEIGKAAAVAQAIVDGIAAVVKTMSSVPFPFNVPLAAAQSLAVGVQISNIESQHLASGIDSVPMGFEGDNFPASLKTGERVVPAETNKDLKAFLQNQGEGGSSAPVLRAILGEIRGLASQPVIVQVDGRTLIEAMRNQIRGGRMVFA